MALHLGQRTMCYFDKLLEIYHLSVVFSSHHWGSRGEEIQYSEKDIR